MYPQSVYGDSREQRRGVSRYRRGPMTITVDFVRRELSFEELLSNLKVAQV